MAKFLFFSDLHCSNHAQFSTILPNGRNSRLQDCCNIILQAQQIAADYWCAKDPISAVIFCGDLFHTRAKIDMDVYVTTWEYVRSLASIVPVYLLKGNHDCHNKVGDVNSLEPFDTNADYGVRVLSEPQRFKVEGCTFQAEPYTADTADLSRRLQTYESADVLLMHQALKEGAVGPYSMTGHGEIGLSDLSLEKWRYVVAGDFHKKQSLSNGKFRYCGSPLQLNFGEAGEDKAFLLLDTTTWSMTEIPTAAPKFYVFNTPTEFLEAKAAGTVRPEVDFVRVLYSETAREEAEIVKTHCERVQIVEESQQKQVLQRVANDIASNDLSLLRAYCEQKAGVLDIDRLISVGIDELLGEQE